jgi:hypothetical protein
MTGPLSHAIRTRPDPMVISDHVSRLSRLAHRDHFSGS